MYLVLFPSVLLTFSFSLAAKASLGSILSKQCGHSYAHSLSLYHLEKFHLALLKVWNRPSLIWLVIWAPHPEICIFLFLNISLILTFFLFSSLNFCSNQVTWISLYQCIPEFPLPSYYFHLLFFLLQLCTFKYPEFELINCYFPFISTDSDAFCCFINLLEVFCSSGISDIYCFQLC